MPPKVIQLIVHRDSLLCLTDTGEIYVRKHRREHCKLVAYWARVGVPDSCDPSKQSSCQAHASSTAKEHSYFPESIKELLRSRDQSPGHRPMPLPKSVDAMSSPRRPTTIGPDGNYIRDCKVHNHLYLD